MDLSISVFLKNKQHELHVNVDSERDPKTYELELITGCTWQEWVGLGCLPQVIGILRQLASEAFFNYPMAPDSSALRTSSTFPLCSHVQGNDSIC